MFWNICNIIIEKLKFTLIFTCKSILFHTFHALLDTYYDICDVVLRWIRSSLYTVRSAPTSLWPAPWWSHVPHATGICRRLLLFLLYMASFTGLDTKHRLHHAHLYVNNNTTIAHWLQLSQMSNCADGTGKFTNAAKTGNLWRSMNIRLLHYPISHFSVVVQSINLPSCTRNYRTTLPTSLPANLTDCRPRWE